MRQLKTTVLLLIAADAPLGAKWKDHPLKGASSGYRECHIGGDFLLIYRLVEEKGGSGGIVFVRAGTHSDLFREWMRRHWRSPRTGHNERKAP